jgi:hypothetical protein
MKISATDPMFLAVKLAQERGLLPTALSSAELQELTLRMKERVFFAARLTNLQALDKIKALVERHVQGEGRDNDLAQLRIEARKILANEGYTPEGGFPGDPELGIPPATVGSLRDLSSTKRLNLIFDTQAALARGLGMKVRNLQRTQQFPAIELIRLKHARQPDWERDWLSRWQIAGDNVNWEGALKDPMIALQTSPIWAALGSSALFRDALNVDYPPFAFNSGMGWRFVGFRESEALGLSPTADMNEPPPSAPEPHPTQKKTPVVETQALKNLREYLDQKYGSPEKWLSQPSAADEAKLQRLNKLRDKFDAITAKRGF